MKNLYTSIFIALFAFSATADAQNLYQRTYSTSNSFDGTDIAWSGVDQSFVLSTLECDTNCYIRIIKTDLVGYPLWTQRVKSAGAYKPEIAVDQSGTIYCATSFGNGNSGSDISYEVTSIAPWGTVNWSQIFVTESFGMYDQPNLTVLADGNLLLTESVWGHVGFLKISPAGSLITAVSISEDSTAESKTPGFSSSVMPDGSFLFTGKRDCDILLTHTDDQGNVLWSRQWNSGSNYYHTKTICTLSDGSSIMGGYEYSSTPFLMKVDNAGNMVWYKWLNNVIGTVRSIKQLNATEFIALVEDNASLDLIRFDANGIVLSSVQMPMSSSWYMNGSILVTPQGKIAWAMNYYIAASTSYGIAFMIMDAFTTTGCAMQPITVTSGPATANPLPVIMPMYKKIQVIDDSLGGAVVSPNPINYLDFCWVVDVPVVQSSLTEFSLQNTPAMQGELVTFSINTYNGDLLYYVTDALGREVIRRDMYYSGGLQPIDKSDQLAPGIYMMTTVINGKTHTGKFVIR